MNINASRHEPRWKVTPAVEGANTQAVMAWLEQTLSWAAPLLFNGEFTMVGNTPAALAQSIKGQATFDGGSGKIDISAIKSSAARVAELAASAGVNVLPELASAVEKVAAWPDVLDYSRLQGDWAVNGVNQDIDFTLDNLGISADGVMDALNDKLDMKAQLVINDDPELGSFDIAPALRGIPIPIRCTGTTTAAELRAGCGRGPAGGGKHHARPGRIEDRRSHRRQGAGGIPGAGQESAQRLGRSVRRQEGRRLIAEPFASRLLAWYDAHGRKDLPWQQPRTPYRVWISEIMLQQTQVSTVIPYFERFITRFPDAQALGQRAAGIPYCTTGPGSATTPGRGNLHKAARTLVADHDGMLPATPSGTRGPARYRPLHGRCHPRHGPRRLRGHPGRQRQTGAGPARHDRGLPGQQRRGKSALGAGRRTHPPGAHRRLHPGPSWTWAPPCAGAGARTALTARWRKTARPGNRIASTTCPAASRPGKNPCAPPALFVARTPDGDVLLEQRPADGLWGGLWNPPERAADYDVEAFLAEYDLRATRVTRGQPFRHTFSHYHLDVEPVYVDLNDSAPLLAADGPTSVWYQPQGTQQQLGLSAVAVRLLNAPVTEDLALEPT